MALAEHLESGRISDGIEGWADWRGIALARASSGWAKREIGRSLVGLPGRSLRRHIHHIHQIVIQIIPVIAALRAPFWRLRHRASARFFPRGRQVPATRLRSDGNARAHARALPPLPPPAPDRRGRDRSRVDFRPSAYSPSACPPSAPPAASSASRRFTALALPR